MSGIEQVWNPLPARGGLAPETLDKAKMFAPLAVREDLQRAVTPEDYASLAGKDARVQRAAAALRWTGSWQEILVALDPLGGPLGNIGADEQLLREIEERLTPYRRMGHELKVVEAEYVPLFLELQVQVLPHYLRGHVEAALLDLFSNLNLSDGSRGFFHPDNLSFGEGVYLSKIVATAQRVTGVESVQVKRFERLHEGPNREIETGVLVLGPMEIARLDNDPGQPGNGVLRLEMKGGR